MRNFTLILMLCFTAMAATALAANDFPVMTLNKNMSHEITFAPGSIDEQPDTIRYDDNSPSTYHGQNNYWVYVRFTAPANFDLYEVYIAFADGDLSSDDCNIYIYGQNGPVQGEALATATIPSPLPGFGWAQGDLTQSVHINSGDDFYVVFGPVPGGNQGTTGYKPLLDSGTTTLRSYACFTNNQFGTYSVRTSGDWLVRAGGVVEAFTDLSASDCFNQGPSGESGFNFLPADEMTLRAYIENVGNSAVNTYTVNWSVEGPDQSVVFNETVNAGPLADGAAEIINSTNMLTVQDEGIYFVTCTVTAEGDAQAENNESYLRMYVGDTPRWFLYDDNDDADGYSGFSEGNGWGLSFTPTSYPAKVCSVRIDVGLAGAADVRIFLNSEEDGSPIGSAVWTSTDDLVAGWNTIYVNPPVNIFSGSFTVAHIFHDALDITQGNDNDQPNQAGNLGMPVIAWQPSGGGTEWFEDEGGNICIQAYVDTSSAVPPYPIIEVSVASLNFGQVTTNTSAPLSFWVYNRGNVDDLNITSFTYTPASFSNAYVFDQSSYTIAAQDSEEVTLTFTPTIESVYNGRVDLVNNSHNDQAFRILLLGSGVTEDVENGVNGLPTEFSLSQNYPNPFNPTTEIQFTLPYDANVNLTVSNLLGQQVATAASGFFNAGYHTVTFNANNLPSGLYFYKLEAADFSAIRKMMLLK